MPRSNWKGFITFGLVSIPIILYNSIDPQSSVSFKQINRKTGARIKYKRVDAETEKEVPWGDIAKGYEYNKDVILPVEEGELKKVAGENARTVDILEFIDKKNISLINVEQTYYLVPDKRGDKGYVILREALEQTNKVGIAKVIISTKEYLAAVSTYENALVLHLLHYDNEIRKLSEFNIPSNDIKKYKVVSKEIEVAKKLINSMTEKWKPEQFKDEYKLAVQKWADEKIHHLPETHMVARSRAAKPTKVVNFVDLLKKSLESSKTKKPYQLAKKYHKIKTIPSKQRKLQRKSITEH